MKNKDDLYINKILFSDFTKMNDDFIMPEVFEYQIGLKTDEIDYKIPDCVLSLFFKDRIHYFGLN